MKSAPSEIFFSCSESSAGVNLTSISLEQQLAASSSGTISLSKNFGVQEEWYRIPSDADNDEDGEETVLILKSSAGAKHGFYLSCTPQHTKTIVATETMDLAMHCSILVSTEGEGDEASVQFLSSSTDPQYQEDSYEYKLGQHTENWHAHGGESRYHPFFLEDATIKTGELCFLSNPSFDKRLRCDVFGKLNMDSNWKGFWEVFRFIEAGDGRLLVIISWTHYSKVLSCDTKGDVLATEYSTRDD